MNLPQGRRGGTGERHAIDASTEQVSDWFSECSPADGTNAAVNFRDSRHVPLAAFQKIYNEFGAPGRGDSAIIFWDAGGGPGGSRTAFLAFVVAVRAAGYAQVFGRRHLHANHALRRPASEKRQGTKSRWGKVGGAAYGDFAAGSGVDVVERGGNVGNFATRHVRELNCEGGTDRLCNEIVGF
jgi:hypothetical protein